MLFGKKTVLLHSEDALLCPAFAERETTYYFLFVPVFRVEVAKPKTSQEVRELLESDGSVL